MEFLFRINPTCSDLFWSFLYSKTIFWFLIVWLYKFLINVLEDQWCTGPGCSTCGSLEFRAKLISNLSCYQEIPHLTNLSKYREDKLIAPIYNSLDDDIKRKIVDEMSDQLKKLTQSQVKHLGEPGYGILTSLFCEFTDKSDYLYSLIIGSSAGNFLKKMIDHNKKI